MTPHLRDLITRFWLEALRVLVLIIVLGGLPLLLYEMWKTAEKDLSLRIASALVTFVVIAAMATFVMILVGCA